jgi:hypothetical protein
MLFHNRPAPWLNTDGYLVALRAFLGAPAFITEPGAGGGGGQPGAGATPPAPAPAPGGQEPPAATPPAPPATFSADYVSQLREEAAGYRTQRNSLQEELRTLRGAPAGGPAPAPAPAPPADGGRPPKAGTPEARIAELEDRDRQRETRLRDRIRTSALSEAASTAKVRDVQTAVRLLEGRAKVSDDGETVVFTVLVDGKSQDVPATGDNLVKHATESWRAPPAGTISTGT